MSAATPQQPWLSLGAAAVTGAVVGAVIQRAMSHRHSESNMSQSASTKNGVGAPLSVLHDIDAGIGGCASCQKPIYLDWNATTPIFPEVTAAMIPYTSKCFGNPSSDSYFSKPCKLAVARARSNLAAMLGCQLHEVVFTSCGTESDNAAIHLALKSRIHNDDMPHIVTSNVEHPAIEECLAALSAEGRVSVTRVPVNSSGVVSADDVAAAITPHTVLVTIMHSNNEVGSINPIAAIGAKCAARNVLFHTDAAQSCGKVPVDVKQLHVDMATIVGHKFGAPKGVAALFIRDGCFATCGRKCPPLYGQSGGFLLGGGQERGRRAGTENVLLIAGLGAACKIVTDELTDTGKHMMTLRDLLQHRLTSTEDIRTCVNGPSDKTQRLPNTLSISFPGVDSGSLVADLAPTVALSAGSACHTGGGVSEVLTALGLSHAVATGTVRISVGRHTQHAEVEHAATHILQAVRRHMRA